LQLFSYKRLAHRGTCLSRLPPRVQAAAKKKKGTSHSAIIGLASPVRWLPSLKIVDFDHQVKKALMIHRERPSLLTFPAIGKYTYKATGEREFTNPWRSTKTLGGDVDPDQ